MTALARGISVAPLLAAWVGASWVGSTTAVRAQDKKTVWDKVYTTEQATKGKVEYDNHCSGCHVKDLSGRDGGGEGPELAGAAFAKKWDFQNLNQLYSEIKTRMPRDQPASLSEEAYLNIVTYILQANKYPAGDDPLPPDSTALANILIARSSAAVKEAASQPITTGSLVQVVGCLQSGPGGWMLTETTAPVRTENPDGSPADQLKKLAATPAGAGKLRLLGVYSSLDEHKGRRMEAKGFIVKDPDGDRLNVVSLEMVATSCAP
jgi:mono/diheme cytochrome c family protein